MVDVDPPVYQIPKAFGTDPKTWTLQDSREMENFFTRWMRDFGDLWLRTGGPEDTVGDTETVVVSHGEKLDFITITQAVNLDTVESDTASNKTKIDAISTSSPSYSPASDGTDRTWNADAATGAISSPPTQAEVENIRDAVLELSDVVATVVRDLAAKSVFDV